ncbi:MAG: hypothetical protein K6F09_01135 [Clostridiales bacterium]|nr:hypothetical protein [Clostridiales bacterium]
MKNYFVSPPSYFYPCYNWVWNTKISEEGIRSEIDSFLKAGIKSLCILPEPSSFRPDSMKTYLEPEYLGEEFFSLVNYAVGYAAEKDMTVWLYDEGGWPSGSACRKVNISLGRGDGFKADITDVKVAEKFIELTHKKYFERIEKKYFPKAGERPFDTDKNIRSARDIFTGTDKKYPTAPLIFDDEAAPVDKEKDPAPVREVFLKKVGDFCKKNNVAFAGHLDKDNGVLKFTRLYGEPVSALTYFDIPGVDVITRQVFKTGNSNDTVSFFPRFASSASSFNGTNSVIAECLAVYGDGVTADEILYLCVYLAARGINLFNFFGLSYGKEKALLLNERPIFDPLKPGFENLKRLNDAAARLSYIMSVGKRQAETLLYLPSEKIYRGDEAAAKAFEKAGELLEKIGTDFDVADDECMCSAVVKDGKIIVKNAEYRSVTVPDGASLPENAAGAKINELKNIKASGNVLKLTRAFDGGRIVLYFNSDHENEAAAEFDKDVGRYVLDIKNGTVKKTEDTRLVLKRGGYEIILYTDDDIGEFLSDSFEGEPRYKVTPTNASFAPFEESVITKDGVKKIKRYDKPLPFVSGDIGKKIKDGFSGTVRYEFEFVLPNDPSDDFIYIFSPGEVRYSARLKYGGRDAGVIAFSGDVIRIEPTEKNIKLTLDVSNTMADAILKTDMRSFFDASEIGPYNETSLLFEKDNAGIGVFRNAEILVYKRDKKHLRR